MDRPTAPRISKTQRETHSEIERKRRERMKRDTEFLRKQLANPQCKDKLSIFQAGAERLIQYTDKLGERDYIINDEEYSRIIMSNFAGFSMHIRCSDGKVLDVSANVEKILDITMDRIVGSKIQDLAEPSSSTKQLIDDVFQCTDFQWDIFNGLISRNFILPLRCGPSIAACHCVCGADGGRYRFIEFCGDLSRQSEESNANETIVSFRGLCRPHDPACSTVQDNECTDEAIDTRGTSFEAKQFTLRLSPNGFRIIEVVGDCETLLGCMAESLLRKPFRDVFLPSEKDSADQLLSEVQMRSPVTGSLHLISGTTGQPVRFDIRLSAIRLGSYFHCVVCRLKLPQYGIQSTEVPFVQMADPDENDGVINCFESNINQPSAVPSTSAPFSRMDSPEPNTELRRSSIQPHSISVSDSGSIVGQQPFSAPDITDAATDRASSRKDLVTGALILNACSEPADDWFRHVDTSGFQNLLNTDYLPSADGY